MFLSCCLVTVHKTWGKVLEIANPALAGHSREILMALCVFSCSNEPLKVETQSRPRPYRLFAIGQIWQSIDMETMGIQNIS